MKSCSLFLIIQQDEKLEKKEKKVEGNDWECTEDMLGMG